MSLAHLTLPTLAVERTARFLEETLGYTRDAAPANSPVETVWMATGGGQQMHIVYVEGFAVSPSRANSEGTSQFSTRLRK